MARKGREPPGLRRYRLAQKRKKTKRRSRPTKVKRVARRRSSKKRRGKGKQSIALLPILPVAFVMKDAYDKAGGLNSGMANRVVEDITGYNMVGGTYSFDQAKPFLFGEAVAIIVHKAANKTGINKHVRKATMGYLSL